MPPVALTGVGMVVVRGFLIVFLAGIGLVDEVAPLLATADHAIDGAPVGESTDVAVVDEEVGRHDWRHRTPRHAYDTTRGRHLIAHLRGRTRVPGDGGH